MTFMTLDYIMELQQQRYNVNVNAYVSDPRHDGRGTAEARSRQRAAEAQPRQKNYLDARQVLRGLYITDTRLLRPTLIGSNGISIGSSGFAHAAHPFAQYKVHRHVTTCARPTSIRTACMRAMRPNNTVFV